MSKALVFAALHVAGDPLILYNAWDVGSARAVAGAGAKAIATGSWSVAAAQGFDDGEAFPLELALAGAARISGAVSLPVTIDFEGGYAVEPEDVAANVARLAATGAVGCNFEDQIVGENSLHPIPVQVSRIAAARVGAGTDFFINARTDIFLQAAQNTHDKAMVDTAIKRAAAYAAAGASGFFAPGLADAKLIAQLCDAVELPVNIMAFPGVPSTSALADAGVSRISYGPGPYRSAMKSIETDAQAVFAWR
ncbi:MAG: isocitrate lyase/phosphoenolpyruvate mutase family protein [Pseudomonadota bacterium]|uniref:isocitrate lyase/PEP mutase family protein n=1 Tax=Sphingomonas sp. ERG5 TaxID=1381597 RepID=UPI00054BF980|nr:isocitrate lyase/phosphoenolpyruvate mutase family protein [Sphingomonas sp. ERG5]